ncbi:Mediator of RNA polymerase II transcription subunit 29 [Acropora cervicornis]|uniref:Mediator of RNA polymerase II transcription subunit 29 n=1 Tax=Acropora cervicornis TaxID=6130 RepID=A0AAD9V4N7_ACRCE|nr:Mediator of RNA polymerase II transcription subunit 29 [Acropora cervicornis]
MATTMSGGNSESENIAKAMKIVKENLAVVVKSANAAISQNSEVDLGTKSVEGSSNKLEKSLEDFYHACDQLKLNLEVMRETEKQAQLSMKYTPRLVQNNSKSDNTTGTQTYTDYLSTVRTQIATAKELKDMLSEFCSAQLS